MFKNFNLPKNNINNIQSKNIIKNKKLDYDTIKSLVDDTNIRTSQTHKLHIPMKK